LDPIFIVSQKILENANVTSIGAIAVVLVGPNGYPAAVARN
jgi:hypothetical protein